MGDVQLTVLLATRNRAQILARVLNGYRCLVAPSARWKLVVVDNGSADETQKVLSAVKSSLPLEMHTEPRAGKNRALNKGLEALEGRLAIITDDDAIPDPMFLASWTKYFESKPECGLFGGSIRPLFEGPPPEWLVSNPHWSAMMFAARDLPEGPVEPDAIYGPNMAVRTSVFRAGFRFDETVGPNALDPLYPTGGETEFCWRVARSGFKCWFASEPLVSHIVQAGHLTLDAMARRAYRSGRARALYASRMGQTVAPPKFRLRQRLALWSPSAKSRFESRCAYHLWRGFRDECAANSARQDRL